MNPCLSPSQSQFVGLYVTVIVSDVLSLYLSPSFLFLDLCLPPFSLHPSWYVVLIENFSWYEKIKTVQYALSECINVQMEAEI